MKWSDVKVIEWLFLIVFIYHLFTRPWPYGTTGQTVMDAFVLVVFFMIIIKHYLLYERKQKQQQPRKK